MAPSPKKKRLIIPIRMRSEDIWARRCSLKQTTVEFKEARIKTDALANQGVELWEDDSVLRCSDGLSEHVGDKEMVGIIKSVPVTDQKAVDALVELACSRGGKDNITIILLTLHYPKPKNIFQKLFS